VLGAAWDWEQQRWDVLLQVRCRPSRTQLRLQACMALSHSRTLLQAVYKLTNSTFLPWHPPWHDMALSHSQTLLRQHCMHACTFLCQPQALSAPPAPSV
jgi:hypothetical protein